jgi:hypothetical protein
MGSYRFPRDYAGFDDGRAPCEHADIIPVNSAHQKREASRKTVTIDRVAGPYQLQKHCHEKEVVRSHWLLACNPDYRSPSRAGTNLMMNQDQAESFCTHRR